MNAPRRSPSPRSNSGTFFGVIFLLAVGGGFLALTAAVVPGALLFVGVLFGFFLFGLMHYCLWGWWLARPQPEDDEADG